MAGAASKKLRQKREAAPLVPYTPDEIQQALEAEKRLQNSYHSLARYLRKHIGCTEEALEPDDGTIMHNLWARKKLRRRHLIAWKLFTRDFERSLGNSSSMVTSYSERVSTSSAGTPRTDLPEDEPLSGRSLADINLSEWNNEHTFIQQKWDCLHKEERGLMEQLIRNHIKVTRGVKIHHHDGAYIGSFLSGYQDNRQCIAAFVSRVQAMMSHLADLYMISD